MPRNRTSNDWNDQGARGVLAGLIEGYGVSLCGDPRRCAGLLMDFCGDSKLEINLISLALESRVPETLLGMGTDSPMRLLIARLSKRLVQEYALSQRAALWAVESWAVALRVIDPDEAITDGAPTAWIQAETSKKIPPGQLRAIQVPHRDIVVSQSGSAEYSRITDAIGIAGDGTRIIIQSGIYREALKFNKKNIFLEGSGPRDEITVEAIDVPCVEVVGDSTVSVTGLSFRNIENRSSEQFSAVEVYAGTLNISNCDVESRSVSGIKVSGGRAKLFARNCRIHDAKSMCGIFFMDGSSGVVEECHVTGNELGGIGIIGRADPIVRNCRIDQHWKGGGVVLREKARGTFEGCEVHDNAIGVMCNGNHSLRIRDCIIRGCSVGVVVDDGGRASFEHSQILECRSLGIGLGHGKVYVGHTSIRANGTVGIKVERRGSGTIRFCEFAENQEGPWDISLLARHRVERTNNIVM